MKFLNKAASTGQSSNSQSPGTTSSPKGSSAQGANASPGKTSTFMLKGKDAHQAVAQAEAEAERRKAEAGKAYRFSMEKGSEAKITFLDGKLDEDGMLDCPMWHEHTLQINGNYVNYVCTAEADQTQPCPICAKGDRPSLVGAFTIIDHRPYKIKNGPNAGKMLQHTRKLFIAKRQTLQQLTAIAKKRDGLAGCYFDVQRIGENSAMVGSQFDFTQKFTTRQEIMDKFDFTDEANAQPLDYSAEITYHSPEELITLGVGKANVGPGYGNKSGGGVKSSSSLSDEL